MMARLRVLLADDEPLARARLRRLLESDGAVDVVAECVNGDEAVAALRALRPDAAFLDIRMPDLDGFRVLDHMAGVQTRVVFVTAHAEHAARAFDADAVDYLLKPLSAQRLQVALQRIRRSREAPSPEPVREGYPQRLAVPVGGRMHLLPVTHIDCMTAQANYVELQAGEQRYLLRETLSGLLVRLDPQQFVQVHRSHAVRIDTVRDIEPLESGQYLLRLHNGARIATGRNYRTRLREALGLSPQ